MGRLRQGSNQNRTNLRVKAGPVDEVAIAFAFELLFGECQGCGATATGLAGDDYSAVLDYLVELEGKFPLASLSSPIPSDCSYGEGNGATLLAGESLAIWKLSGKMIHHKNHVRIEKAFESIRGVGWSMEYGWKRSDRRKQEKVERAWTTSESNETHRGR